MIATGTGSAGGSPRVSVAGGGGDIMQMLNEVCNNSVKSLVTSLTISRQKQTEKKSKMNCLT